MSTQPLKDAGQDHALGQCYNIKRKRARNPINVVVSYPFRPDNIPDSPTRMYLKCDILF